MLKQLVLVFIGGGLGSMLRYYLGSLLNNTRFNIPLGTFTVNVFGCLIIGIIFGLSLKNKNFSSTTILLVATGFCGGFTTFSTFALENQTFLKDGNIAAFLGYMLLSITIGLLMVFFGVWLTK